MTKNRIAALLSLFLLAFFCCQCCSVHLLKPTSVQLAKDTTSETVALMNDVDLKPELAVIWPDKVDLDKEFVPKPFCSGVMVADGVVLSANHCFAAYKRNVALKHGLDRLITIAQEKDEMDKLRTLEPEMVGLLVSMLGHAEDSEVVIPVSFYGELENPFDKPSAMHRTVLRASYPGKDLVFLNVSSPRDLPRHRVAHLADARPPVGSHIEGMGHIVGEVWTYREGVVAAYRRDAKYMGLDTDGPFMQVSMTLDHGDSGSGIYDSDGCLVGVADFIDTDTKGVAFGIDVETIRAAMIGQKLLRATIIDLTDQADPSLSDDASAAPNDVAN